MDSKMTAFGKGNEKFNRNYMKAISSVEKGNFVSSPLNSYIGLGMTSLGAKGQTAEIMTKALCFPSNAIEASQSFAQLIQDMQKSSYVDVFIANKIYLKEGYEILPEYVAALKNSFETTIQMVDFSEAATVGIINSWVADQTNDKIHDIVEKGCFDDLTRLVLVNTLYFKGDWRRRFHRYNTENKHFFTDEAKKVKVPMMQLKCTGFNYADLDDLDAQLLQLPYENGDFSFVIFLPNTRNGLDELEKKLASKNLNELMQQTEHAHLDVSLPKFKIETVINMEKPLSKMGLKNIFSNKADFSGIATAEPLTVTKIIQKAIIEVNEEGTVAYNVRVALFGGGPPPVVKAVVNCDHPFYYILAYKKTFALFGGRLTCPKY